MRQVKYVARLLRQAKGNHVLMSEHEILTPVRNSVRSPATDTHGTAYLQYRRVHAEVRLNNVLMYDVLLVQRPEVSSVNRTWIAAGSVEAAGLAARR